jgi:threonine synthase
MLLSWIENLRQAQSDNISENFVGILLETAHPAKFVEVVEDVLKEIIIPEKLEAFNKKKNNPVEFSVDFESLKSYLMEK